MSCFINRRGLVTCACPLLAMWAGAVMASPIFTGLGALPDGGVYSRAHNISGDGTTVVGESGESIDGYYPWAKMAFRWTESTGMQFIGIPENREGRAFGVSRDGAVVVGEAAGSGGFMWRGGTLTFLSPSAFRFDIAQEVSDDGSVAVGSAEKPGEWGLRPAKWSGGAVTRYDDPAASGGFQGIAIVGGQEIISGMYNTAAGNEPALYRNGSPQPLGVLGNSAVHGFHFGAALDVSRNGEVTVGYSSSPRADEWYEAFRWTSREGMTPLGDLAGGAYGSWAWSTSANGGVIVGNSVTRYSPTYRGVTDAFYWTPVTGMKKLKSWLQDGFQLDLSGWNYLEDATGVSDNGLAIAGWGTRANGVEEAFRVKLQQQIYINWDDAIGASFRVQRIPRTLQWKLVTTTGAWPTLAWPATIGTQTIDEYKDEVILHLGSMFAAAGAPIDILDSRHDAKPSAALEVRFGPPVRGPNGESVADGLAWNVGPRGLPGVDRFNMRWDGEVALFFDRAAPWTPEVAAMQIAHEVGHGLGLRHVRPDALGPNEVMDYYYNSAAGGVEQFNDVATPIVEPPDATGKVLGQTHNPVYHLKRYVMGEDVGASKAGTWDTGAVTIQKFEVTNLNLPGSIYNLAPGTSPGGGTWAGEGAAWSNVAYFAEVDPAHDVVSFFSYAGLPLSIYASSAAGDVWDLVFGTGDAENPVFGFDKLAPGSFSGSIFQYDAQSDAYRVIGSFAGTVSEELTLDGAPIPEPATWLLFALGGVALGACAARMPRRRC